MKKNMWIDEFKEQFQDDDGLLHDKYATKEILKFIKRLLKKTRKEVVEDVLSDLEVYAKDQLTPRGKPNVVQTELLEIVDDIRKKRVPS
jgi:hypothetical protein